MAEISSKTGEDFNRTIVDRLRAAHGTVFGLIAEVRAGTNNPTILNFATQANNIVLKHMALLEQTGYVTAGHGQFAEAAAQTTAYSENTLSTGDIFLGGLLFAVLAAGTIFTARTLNAGEITR